MVTHFECSKFLHVNLEIVLEICKQSLLKYRQSRATLNQSRVVFQSLKDFSCLLPHTLVLIWCRQKRPHLCRNVAFFLPNLDNIADWMLEKARNNFLTKTWKTTKWLLITLISLINVTSRLQNKNPPCTFIDFITKLLIFLQNLMKIFLTVILSYKSLF